MILIFQKDTSSGPEGTPFKLIEKISVTHIVPLNPKFSFELIALFRSLLAQTQGVLSANDTSKHQKNVIVATLEFFCDYTSSN